MNQKSSIHDVIIIGGGLSGLISALHLSKNNINVLLIEKNTYPKHKVCGEYISNEVIPYLHSLDFYPLKKGAKNIKELILTTPKKRSLKRRLPLGGFGMSRYQMDFELAEKVKEKGVTIVHQAVSDVRFDKVEFFVQTKTGEVFSAKLVIGAYGKRSNIDIKLNRDFIKKEAPYLAVKAHYKGDFPDDLVALHNFKGGYCGVSRVETDAINVCYIADYEAFKKYKNIADFQENVLSQNPLLKELFSKTENLFSAPITISQISFAPKKPVEQHILMCGDTAGLIHPLCGNGMGMAIHSAQIASELIVDFFNGKIESREILEKEYTKQWNKTFKKRLSMGRKLAALFRMDAFSEFMLIGLKMFPWLLTIIIKKTHGKPLSPIKTV